VNEMSETRKLQAGRKTEQQDEHPNSASSAYEDVERSSKKQASWPAAPRPDQR